MPKRIYQDGTRRLVEAVQKLRRQGGGTLRLESAEYHLTPDKAPDRLCFISNNDSGVKRIAVDLTGMNDVEIDGQGARLIVHGRLLPFWLECCRNITIRNLVIDWDRHFTSHGQVTDSGEDWADLWIDPTLYPHEVRGSRLFFTGDRYESEVLHNFLEFDPDRRGPIRGAKDQFPLAKVCHAEARPHGRVRIHGPWNGRARRGQSMVIMHDHRDCPAISLSHATDVLLEDITLHHAGAMGVIAQRSRDVRLQRVNVCLEEGSGHLVSTYVDATHFVGCSGHIELIDCRFENQMDDGTNIHGVFAEVLHAEGNQVDCRLGHFQQLGFVFADAGDIVVGHDRPTLEELGRFKVKCVQRINAERFRLVLDTSCSGSLVAGTVLRNDSCEPNATVRGCYMARNRARGLLLSTAGRILVEDSVFETAGAAIAVNGGCDGWFESGPIRDLTIRRNVFRDCYQDIWGKAVIQITPKGANLSQTNQPIHGHVHVIDNQFVEGSDKIIFAESVKCLEASGNTIVRDGLVLPVSPEHVTLQTHCGVRGSLACHPMVWNATPSMT